MIDDVKHIKNPTSENMVLLVTTIASFIIPFMASAINIALPAISKELDINAVTLGWVTNAYILTSASLLVPFGRIADIHGRRKVFILGTIIFTLGCILSAISASSIMLLSSRALQGIGGAAMFSTSVAILTSVFSSSKRGRVLGINTASVYLGLSLGPVLGGLLTHYAGWRGIFVLCSGLSLMVIAISFWILKMETARVTDEKFDLAGSVVYTTALVATLYGVTILPTDTGIWLIIIGAASALVFFWRETRTQAPLLNLNLFRHNRGFTFSNLAALISYSGSWAVTFLLSLYLQYIKGFDPQTAGLILVTNPAVQAILSPITGRLSDRIEPRVLASIGMFVTTLAIGLLALLINESTSTGYILACLGLLGLGFALFSSPNTNAVMSSTSHQFYGVASATLATSRQIGMMLSMTIAMLVFAMLIGRVEITVEYYAALVTSVRIIFLISTALCFGGAFASLARGNIRRNTINKL